MCNRWLKWISPDYQICIRYFNRSQRYKPKIKKNKKDQHFGQRCLGCVKGQRGMWNGSSALHTECCFESISSPVCVMVWGRSCSVYIFYYSDYIFLIHIIDFFRVHVFVHLFLGVLLLLMSYTHIFKIWCLLSSTHQSWPYTLR